LRIAEWPDFSAPKIECAEEFAVFTQRHNDRSARACEVDDRPAEWGATAIGVIVFHIDCMDVRRARLELRKHFSAARLVHVSQVMLAGGRQIPGCGNGEFSVLETQHDTKRSLAKAHCFFEHRVEYRGEVARRGID